MKLRIRGNSVRLRVSRSEVAQLEREGYTEDGARFGAAAALRYAVVVEPAGEVRAAFDGSRLAVHVPRHVVERWLDPEQVSIGAEQALPGGETLKILVEKDFACLAPRTGEDDSDLFPNPAGRTE